MYITNDCVSQMLQQREKDFADKDLKELVLARLVTLCIIHVQCTPEIHFCIELFSPRYAYVDTDEDKATHRPVLSKAVSGFKINGYVWDKRISHVFN